MAVALEAPVHAFEKAGLGKAPFRYVGEKTQDIRYGEAVIGSVGGCEITTKRGGTCAFCGVAIINMFKVASSCGNEFVVGCECIKKTGDTGLIRKVNKVIAENAKKRKAQKDADFIAEAKAKLPTVCGTLADQPHLNEWRAKEGETLLSWVKWMLENASTGGKIKAAMVIHGA